MLFTVLIIDHRGTYQHFESYRYLFQPFIDAGRMAVCVWNEDGDRVERALPRLKALTQDHAQWRAIVVNPDGFNDEHASVLRSQNPFDYSGVDVEEGPHESPVPLVRLTHILGGYPASPKCFEEAYECYEGDEGEVLEGDWEDFGGHKSQTLRVADVTAEDRERYTLKSVYIESHDDHLAEYRRLSEKYGSFSSKPSELWLVGLRQYERSDVSRLREVWQVPNASCSSSFWERNKYPGHCRFLFAEADQFDCYHLDKLMSEFWFSILTLSLNRIPSAMLQAYRLYRISIDIDVGDLQQCLNLHLDHLEGVKSYLKAQREKLPEYTMRSDRVILERQNIEVLVEKHDEKVDHAVSLDSGKANIQAHGAFSTDRRDVVEMASMLLDPRRAIERAANAVRRKADQFCDEHIILDEFQYQDLQKEAAELEKKVFSVRPRNTYDAGHIESSKAAYQKANRNLPQNPLTHVEQVKLTCVAMLIALVGFIPYFVDLSDSDGRTIIFGVLICIFVLIVTAIGGYMALIPFAKKISARILKNDQIIHQAHDHRVSIEQKYGDHFTNICTYMKAQALLSGATVGQDEIQVKRHQYLDDLRKTEGVIAIFEHWLSQFRLVRECGDREGGDSDEVREFVSFGTDHLDESVFSLPLPADDKPIPLNASGHKIDAPYEFVSQLTILREEVFDDLVER